MSYVSIVIPTYNAGDGLDNCLDGIFAQQTPWTYDVHAIDSGSTDGTVAMLRRYGVSVTEIPNHEFSHGGTRNAAASQVSAEYIVFTVQDAIPQDDDWLRLLVGAVEETGAAGAFSAQIAPDDASLYTRWSMESGFPASGHRLVKEIGNQRSWQQLTPQERYQLCFFHDASSCVRRSVFQSCPYRDVPYAEDLDWAKRVLLAGESIVYEPNAVVIHAHDRSVNYEFKRAYSDHAVANDLFGLRMHQNPLSIMKNCGWSTVNFGRWARAHSSISFDLAAEMAAAVLRIGALNVGSYIGSRSSDWLARYRLFSAVDRWLRQGV